MKILTVCVAAALALSATASVYAADANQNVVTRDFTDTVAPAEQAAYEAGVKAYNECLHQHGLKFNEIALTHETGNTYVYAYEIGPYTWADFDKIDAESKPCDATWRSQSNPHLKSEISLFFTDQPEMSHMPVGWRDQPVSPLLDVIYFTLKPGHAAHEAFTSAVKKITAAAAKTKSTVYYRTLEVQAGDDGAPDYVLVLGLKSWADFGALGGPWKMVESAYGKAAADAIRASLNDSIAKSSSHIDSYKADLSYFAGK